MPFALAFRSHSGHAIGAAQGSAKGSVDFTQTSPRKVTNISLRGGATVRDVGIGSTLADPAAFPDAKVDRSTEEVFHITLAKIAKSDGGKFEFGVEMIHGRGDRDRHPGHRVLRVALRSSAGQVDLSVRRERTHGFAHRVQ